MKLLHINASTRGAKSESLAVARHLIAELQNRTSIELDEYNLFEDELPKFDGLAVGAKMALFTGSEAESDQKAAWEKIKAVFDRFASADVYVFNVPLWNNGIPYVLKQFIDVVTQPGWTMGFDVEKGYTGLLNGKKAYVVHASGVYYQGIPDNFGSDFSTSYLDDWLKFIGVEDVEHIHVAPTVVNADFAKTKTDAETKASQLASSVG
ncbi:FMN-dependent NADH-azoreductase [Pseudogemmobacter sonorensis]|uniref:FMN-dependent NADH-azoreductase n=1 Tax=Pseudogemmobacter sonorensis TaxID=2989681 RepID=UPI0036CA2D98